MSQDVSHRGRGRVARSGANLRGHRGSRKRHVLPPVNNRRSHGGVEESVSRCSRRGGCMTRVCVVGAGAWGTAIANLAAVKATVVLWVHGEDTLMTLRDARENTLYLPGVRLQDNVTPTGRSIAESQQGAGAGNAFAGVSTAL